MSKQTKALEVAVEEVKGLVKKYELGSSVYVDKSERSLKRSLRNEEDDANDRKLSRSERAAALQNCDEIEACLEILEIVDEYLEKFHPGNDTEGMTVREVIEEITDEELSASVRKTNKPRANIGGVGSIGSIGISKTGQAIDSGIEGFRNITGSLGAWLVTKSEKKK